MGIFEVAKEMFINKGRELGRKEAERNHKRLFITNMINLTNCSDKEISELVEVTLAFAQQVRSEIKP